MDSSRLVETVTIPPRQRHACVRCFKRKQKCDRLSPRCTNCGEAGTECHQRIVNPSGQATSTDEDSIEIPVGEGYISSLKRKVSHLESLHERKRQHTEDTTTIPITPTPERQNARAQDPALGQALGEYHHLVLTSMAAEHSTVRNAASQLSLSGQILKHASVSKSFGSTEDGSLEHHYHQQIMDAPVAFSERQTSTLFDTYLHKVHWRHPYCEEESLRKDYAYTLQRHEQSESAALVTGIPQRMIPVYLSVATAGFLSNSIPSRVFASQIYLSAANLFFQHSSKLPPLDLVRCMTAMVICSLYTSEAGDTWHLLGIAISTAISLGMHQKRSATSDNPASQRELESLFTVLYMLDRVISSSLKKPFAINIEDAIPALQHTDPMGEARSNFKRLVDYAQLLDCLHQKPKPVMFHVGSFMQWRSALQSPRNTMQNLAAKEQHLRHLCCALIAILHHIRNESTTISTTTSDRLLDLKRTAIETSSAWLNTLSKVFEDDIVPATVLDSYDITDIGIQCTAAYMDVAESEQTETYLNIVPSLVAECTALVGSLVGRFPAAKPFRKALSLCSQVMQSGGIRQQSLQDEHLIESFSGVPRPMMEALLSILST